MINHSQLFFFGGRGGTAAGWGGGADCQVGCWGACHSFAGAGSWEYKGTVAWGAAGVSCTWIDSFGAPQFGQK